MEQKDHADNTRKPTEYQVSVEQAIEQYGDVVRRLARLNTTSVQDAEDIYQEVFIKLYRNQEHIENEEHLKAWLIRVTVNECHSQSRKAYRHHEVFMEDAAPIEQAVEGFEERFMEDEVYQKVEKLPKKYREVVLLYYYEDLSIKEIAELLQISENTVKTRLVRARSKLLTLLIALLLVIVAAIIISHYYWKSLHPVSIEEISHVYTPDDLAETIHTLAPIQVGEEVLIDLPEEIDASIVRGKFMVWKYDSEESGSYVLWMNSSDIEKRMIDPTGSNGEDTCFCAKIPQYRFMVGDTSGHRQECTAVEMERGEDYAIYNIILFVLENTTESRQYHSVTLRVKTDSDYEHTEILGCYVDSPEEEGTEESYSFTEGVRVSPFAYMRNIGYDDTGHMLPMDEWEGVSGVFSGFDFSGELIVDMEPITQEDYPQYVFTLLDSEGNEYWTDLSEIIYTEE